MRQDNTHWNKSYKNPNSETDDLAKELRRKRRRTINRTGAQISKAEHWDKFFEIRKSEHIAKKLHPDDLVLGESRRSAEQAQEDRELEESLSEVWD